MALQTTDYWVERSRAVEPLFFRAPHPPSYGNPGKTVPLEARPYQFAGTEFALARPHCLIGDVPGVGKTVQAILISNTLGPIRTLVICPASLRLNWEKEIARWSSLENVSIHVALKNVSAWRVSVGMSSH